MHDIICYRHTYGHGDTEPLTITGQHHYGHGDTEPLTITCQHHYGHGDTEPLTITFQLPSPLLVNTPARLARVNTITPKFFRFAWTNLWEWK